MNIPLATALISALVWVVFAWLIPVGVPAIHLLLALAGTLFVYGVGRKT